MTYINSLTEENLCKLILGTKESLFICLPLLHPKVIDTIDELHYNLMGKVTINIGIDFSPETFRQGYGEIGSYKGIWETNYNIRNLKDNRISFFISDTVGYYLFFESRYFIPAEKVTLNAASIDPVSIVRLKQHFFGTYSKADYADQIGNAIIDESIQHNNIGDEIDNPPEIFSTPLDLTTIETVEKDLSQNPPLKPDYKRIVEFYSNKFQYVRLEFNGSNLKTKKIVLPKNALPIANTELKNLLETKLDLFDKENSLNTFATLDDFKAKIQELREEFLTSLTIRKENILKKNDKVKFENEVETLRNDIKNVSLNLLQLVSQQIELTKKRLLKELSNFFFENPEFISPDDLFLKSDDNYKKQEAQNLASKTIHHIKWPRAHELVSEFSLITHYSDITFEDLSNEELINELKSRGLIDDYDLSSLADFGKGIKINS